MPRFQLKQNGERPTYTRKDNMLIYGKTPKDYIKMIRGIDGYIKYLMFCACVVIFLCVIGAKGLANQPNELKAMDEFMDRLLQNATKTDEQKQEGHDWNIHLELCKVQYQLDVDIGQSSLAILNGKNGFVRCPISQFWPADQSNYPEAS